MKIKMGKSSGIKLFVGGIDPITTKESMQSYFEQYTCVIHCKVETGKKLRLSKGFGYVTVPNMKIVEWLLSFEHHIDGKKVDIEVAIKKPKKKKPFAPIFEETSPFKYGIYYIDTGLTSNSNRPNKSFLDIDSSNLKGYITSNQMGLGVYSLKHLLGLDHPNSSVHTTSKHEGSFANSPAFWESAKEHPSSAWQLQTQPLGRKNVPDSLEAKKALDCGLPERAKTKHSKYEFISDQLNEAAANYKFNKRREVGFQSPTQPL